MNKIFEILENKKITLLFIILNFIGVFAAWYTYSQTISYFILEDKFYLIPLVPVSFLLYFSMAIFLLYLYFDFKVPKLFGVFTFYINFIYGIGSVLFYIIFMIFIDGFSVYHFWNIFAHGFLGLQAVLILNYVSKLKIWQYLLIFFIFIIKDFMDIFYGTFTYFIEYDFGYLKYFVIGMILFLQIIGIILLKYSKEIN
ncbi:hypothetical protein J4440_06795 [Candidatus Woesearchaeota archaeon]|nr:hypothetical protein [Candidatus Woesearchaeota archaeon]